MHPSRALRMFRPSARLMKSVHEEDHAAHTISQRLRKLKRIPPELIPLGVVVAVAVTAAGYSLVRKLWVDRTMRLARSNRKD